MPTDPQRVQALFLAAVERPAADRAAFLDSECGGDAELRRRVEALLRAHDAPESFLAQPVVPAPATGASMPNPGEPGRPAPEPVAPETVGSRVGPYQLMQKLGEGGMGTVWVAEQQEPIKRRVALKVIKPGMDSAQILRRFRAERQALALMDHTNIAKVFDAGATPEGRPFFVMELVPGVPITRYCDELHLPIQERLALFVPVCQAIQHAHQKGIIHRDIKPSNVLVCMQDGKPVPKVIDFGVAKAVNQPLAGQSLSTEVGQVIGTLEYMAPEQAELSALDIDTRADVYALGVLLYELLTGTTPLDRQRLRQAAFAEMLRIIKEEEPPRPSTRLTGSQDSLASAAALRRTEPIQLAKQVRGELDWIVMKALDKDRTRRYETPSALAQDVERHLADEPVEACPPSRGYRLRKFVRKHRAAVLTATVLLVVLAAGAVLSAWQAMRAREAEARALEEWNKAKEQAAIAKEVNEFLQNDLLRQASSRSQADRHSAKPNRTVRQALDRAAERMKDLFQKHPEPAIRQAIAEGLVQVYETIGDKAKAAYWRKQLDKAKAAAKKPKP
jgi:serine/threonine protein kinase